MPHRGASAGHSDSAKWPACVLFDFDGVLVHSEPLHYRAFRETAREVKIDLTEGVYYEQLIGFDDRGAWKHLFELNGRQLDAPTLLKLMARKGALMRDLIFRRQYHALPGVEEFVRGLWRDTPLAIVSGALRDEIEAMLEGIALRDCFGVIVAAEDVDVGKPDPRGYVKAMHELAARAHRKFEPSQCLIVEDAPQVIHTAKQVGFKTLGVATTYFADRLSEADYVVKSLRPEEVLTQIPKLKLLQA
jgi:beta-phosphoglucomutase